MKETDIIVNLKTELKRGTLTISVLSQLYDKQYGYSLLQILNSKGIEIEAGTLYPMLRRLEKQNLLSCMWDTTESKPRKYYVLSDFGKTVLEELKVEWETMKKVLDTLIEEDKSWKL